MIYHSALPKYDKGIDPMKIINNFDYRNNSFGFTHNLINGVPDKYKNVDCIYFEPFWESGFSRFKLNNKLDFELNDIINSISEFIEEVDIPVFTIVSKHTTKKLPSTKNIKRAILHDYESNVLMYNADIDIKNNIDNFSIIKILSEKYNSIGDFMCGYGNTIIPFAEKNKRFICSDLLPKCISTTFQRLNNLN